MIEWYKLDNIGHLYVPIASKNWSGVFRLSSVLIQKVNPQNLQKAIDLTYKRMPYLFVVPKKGFFWNYLEKTDAPPKLEKDDKYPCQKNFLSNSCMIRVLYFEYRIAVECFHGVLDGGGAWILFNSLLKNYLLICGNTIVDNSGCIDMFGEPSIQEYTDNYLDYYNPKYGYLKFNHQKAYQINYKNTDDKKYFITHFVMDVKELKQVSQKYNATVGVFLCAVLAYSLYKQKQNTAKFDKKKIIINTSIDLRKRFGMHSLRNNFACKYMTISNLPHTFESILSQLKGEFATINREYLTQFVNTNVKTQRTIVSRLIPRIVKDCITNLAYNLTGERLASISMSNYGAVAVPKEFKNYIHIMESVNGVAKVGRGVEASVVTFEDNTTLTICCKSQKSQIDNYIVDILNKLRLSHYCYGNTKIDECYNTVANSLLLPKYFDKLKYTESAKVDNSLYTNPARLVEFAFAFVFAMLVGLDILYHSSFGIAYLLPIVNLTVYIVVLVFALFGSKFDYIYQLICLLASVLFLYLIGILFRLFFVWFDANLFVLFGVIVFETIILASICLLRPAQTKVVLDKKFHI